MTYCMTTADEYVTRMYETVNMHKPSELCPRTICERLGKSLVYLPAKCTRVGDVIYMDSRLSREECWQTFGHELCHLLWHHDNQLHLSQSFIDMQERDANNFAYYACVPSCMLMNIELSDDFNLAVHRIATTFNVTPAFAKRRLEIHISKLYQLVN